MDDDSAISGVPSARFSLLAVDPDQKGDFGHAHGKVMLLPRADDPFATPFSIAAPVIAWSAKAVAAEIPSIPPGQYWVEVVTSCGNTVSPLLAWSNEAIPPVITVLAP